MNEILAALMAFAINNSGLSNYNREPEIILRSPQAICRKASPFSNCSLLIQAGTYPEALYDWRTNQIWLSRSINTSIIWDRSVIVHEFVHFLQDQNMKYDKDCPNKHEIDAYTIQGKYILSQDANIPRSLLYTLRKVKSTCNPDIWSK